VFNYCLFLNYTVINRNSNDLYCGVLDGKDWHQSVTNFLEVSALLDHKIDEVLVTVIRKTRALRARLQLGLGAESSSSDTETCHGERYTVMQWRIQKFFRESPISEFFQ